MNHGRAAVATLVATLIYYMVGFFTEGWLFRGDFTPYSAVYRTSDTVMRYMPLGMVFSFIGIFVVTVIYARVYSGTNGLLEGTRLGVLIGIFVACLFVGTNYVILNIGGETGAQAGPRRVCTMDNCWRCDWTYIPAVGSRRQVKGVYLISKRSGHAHS
jgi:hypothetical protein